MTSTCRRCLMGKWIVLLLLVFITPAAPSSCQSPPPAVSATENVLNGTKILKINYTSDQNWSIKEAYPKDCFTLEKGKTSYYLVAAKDLDYDELKEAANNMFVNLKCESVSGQTVVSRVSIILNSANEFTPEFNQSVYNRTISENARIGDIVFNAPAYVSDKDYDDVTYLEAAKSPQGKNALDGIASGKFKMANGKIIVAHHLDYEEQEQYIIKIVVKDSGGKENSTKLFIKILDVDEFGPVFLPKPCATKKVQCQIPVFYHAQIKAADKGEIAISPKAVKAVDMEVNKYSVRYSFKEGTPTNIEKYFKIDPQNAVITKDEELPKNVTSPITLFIKAEEQSELKHSSIAILIMDILDRNSTVNVSTKSSDSISVGAIFTLLGVLLSAILVFSTLGLAFWIRRNKHTHQPLPGSYDYFTRPNLSTKVFPVRDKRASESYTGSSTIMTTICRGDSDETITSDRPISDQPMARNLSANDSVKCCLKEVANVLENRQRPTPKSLRSLALPIRSERTAKKGQLEKEFMRRGVKSEEIFLEHKSPTGSNFGTFRSSYSTTSRGPRKVTNGTLETYVSEYPTLGCESPSYSMSRNSSNLRDTEKSTLIGANDGRSLPGSPLPFRVERCKRERENVDSEQSHSVHMDAEFKREDPNMPKEIAPPIPCGINKTKRQTPTKPPRKFPNKEKKQLTQSYDQQIRTYKIPKDTAESFDRGTESSILVQGRQTNSLNKPVHITDLSERARRSPKNSSEPSSISVHCASNSRSSLPRSSSNTTRLTEAQITERACRSLEKKLCSLEKSRISNARLNQTLEESPKKSERVRRQTPSVQPLPLYPLPNDSIVDAPLSAETLNDTHHFCLGDSAQRKRWVPPSLPTRKSNITPVTNTTPMAGMQSSEEDDPQYVNVKYLSLIGDSATDLSNRLAEFSSSSSLSQNHSQGDEESVYLEPASMQPCLEADLNIRAKLELILASALQKKKETERKNKTDSIYEKKKEETTLRNNSLASEILPVAKFANPNSSSSSSFSERDELISTSCHKSRSLENIFLGSADVVWPDPETTIAALRQHHLAMEDYTAVCLARQKQEPTSPCNSITSNSSNASRCHFGRVNSCGQFIVDIPCAESNVRVAKTATPKAIPFRDVETSMEVGMNSPTASGEQNNAKENIFPQTISFDGIDQYEMVHKHMIPQPSSQIRTPLEQTVKEAKKVKEAGNCASKKQTVPKTNLEREKKSSLIIDSLVNMLNIESYTNANGRISNKSAVKSSCSSRSLSILSNDRLDSSSQDTDTSIRSDCATVMSSELYEPSDSDRETVRSLKLFDSIFDNEDPVNFSSAESDSQSVFRACHPVSPVPTGRLSTACNQIPLTPSGRLSSVCNQTASASKEQLSPVCLPTVTNQVEKEIGQEEDDDDGDEGVEGDTDDVMTQTSNGRTGSYSVSVGLPNGVDAVYKDPVLNAYKTVNEDGSALNITKLPRTFVKMKKSKRVGRKTRHRLKVSAVY